MPRHTASTSFRCLRRARTTHIRSRSFVHGRIPSTAQLPSLHSSDEEAANTETQDARNRTEPSHAPPSGAMSQRLAHMTEEALEVGGSQASQILREAAFHDEIRQKLEDGISAARFRDQHAAALAQAALPRSAGQSTRDIAGSRPWSGTEAVEDTTLRMLTDTHKPLRGNASGRKSSIQLPNIPVRIDTGRAGPSRSSGMRLANARDRSSVYSMMKDSSMSKEEKMAYQRELKERFSPVSRAVPATISGLASLANERIEDAIARGQFKNLPRGQKLERDYNMSSPFIDTTEYFMNKIIQKQEIVPPWIEKQQELVSTATKFRARLRNEWKRHASRLIASKGGTLEEQLTKARVYAQSEAIANPPKKRMLLSAPDQVDRHMSPITLAGDLKVVNQNDPQSSAEGQPSVPDSAINASIIPSSSAEKKPLPPPFRDPLWEANEKSFLTLTVNTLNSMTRSYNLMAPDLAKKPYFSLERELRACYADVAPQLADAIRASAMAPKPPSFDIQSGLGRRAHQLLDQVSGKYSQARSRDSTNLQAEEEKYDGTKPYGLRQFWKDLWAPPKQN